ncbi:hypothetical protein GUITHDRAFT_64270 [Guillardia theta CCMP2712]|uniref:Glycine transporter domain-containing protein n=1 Tax=Guillardia theta (strain CCMP2712) TaxID=905079 RepID=L1K029_GUITC|nr:hypothetical protein GUITHDRAFT_64270 [Guillardia theta CCMP2712]EKX53728.1 hypothetical protein GUITHDRAFT_64270 [Guillardia theta CCMP2712]|eukprot:XP_005840708.1 hypothetical protein GUITHDRAFT_64270 [Guillardia theta CCMP2712]
MSSKPSGEAAGKNHLEDRLSRYPELSVGGILRAGDYLGTATFAMTGTLTAASSGMDLLGCVVIGTITAVGGGTIRDMLLGHENGKSKRAFWMDEQEYLWISILSSVMTFFWWNHAAQQLKLSQEDTWIFWLDSCGIGVFCCIGAMNGVRAGLSPFLSALCGMITSTFGGLTRDVLTHRPVRILHSHAELYATTAFCGGGAYVAARMMGMPMYVRAASGFVVGFGLRTVAWLYDIKLPVKESIYHH